MLQSDAKLVAQTREEKKFQTAASFVDEAGEVGIAGLGRMAAGFVGVDGVAKAKQGPFQREGEFAYGHGFAGQLILEIMKNTGGGVPKQFGFKIAVGFAYDLDGNHIRRAGN